MTAFCWFCCCKLKLLICKRCFVALCSYIYIFLCSLCTASLAFCRGVRVCTLKALKISTHFTQFPAWVLHGTKWEWNHAMLLTAHSAVLVVVSHTHTQQPMHTQKRAYSHTDATSCGAELQLFYFSFLLSFNWVKNGFVFTNFTKKTKQKPAICTGYFIKRHSSS